MNAIPTSLKPVAMPLPAPTGKRAWRAFWSALGLELTLLGVALVWLAAPVKQMPLQVVPLTIEMLDKLLPAPVPEPVRPDALPPAAAHPATPASPARPVPPVAVRRVAPAAVAPIASAPDRPVAPTPPVVPAAAVASVTPAEAPPSTLPATTPHAAPAVSTTADASATYNAKIAAAVQAAFQVPMAASALAFKGRVRVEFALQDGRVGTARVLLSSGLGAVDQAALRAVRSATYPPPPSALAGVDGTYQIWVACY